MLRPALFLLAVLPFTMSQARAADASPLAVAGDIYTLIAETTMVSIEVEPVKHAAKAREILERLDTTLPPAIAALAGADAARVADLTMQWEDLRGAYEGTSFAIAFRENSYDTNLTAHYTSGSDALLMAFSPAASAEASASPAQQVRLRVLQTIASYLRIATGIVGGTSFSANDKDNDIPAGVAAVDAGLAELKKQYAGTAHAAALKKASARWAFLKPALVTSGNESAPFVAYTQGLAVANALEALAREAKAAN